MEGIVYPLKNCLYRFLEFLFQARAPKTSVNGTLGGEDLNRLYVMLNFTSQKNLYFFLLSAIVGVLPVAEQKET